MATPFWDVEETVKEVPVPRPLGFARLLFTGEPMRFGLPTFGDSLGSALDVAEELNMPIHFHIGGGRGPRVD